MISRQKRNRQNLKKLSPNAVVLKSVLIESDDIDYDSEATISSDEREHCIPEPLTSFYEPDAINFSDEKLDTYSRWAYNIFIRCCNKDHYKNLSNITKQQSLSLAWNIHRAGRTTASSSKMAFEAKVESPSKTFFNQIMQYGFFEVLGTRYGKYMERENLSQNILVNIMNMSQLKKQGYTFIQITLKLKQIPMASHVSLVMEKFL